MLDEDLFAFLCWHILPQVRQFETVYGYTVVHVCIVVIYPLSLLSLQELLRERIGDIPLSALRSVVGAVVRLVERDILAQPERQVGLCDTRLILTPKLASQCHSRSQGTIGRS